MKLKLKLFGITKEIIGQAELEYLISVPINVSRLRDSLMTAYPKLAGLNSLVIAVNGEYVMDDRPLNEQDEIVLIPPVSGG